MPDNASIANTELRGEYFGSHNKSTNGPLLMIGGRFESDNQALFEVLKTHSNGRIAVLSMASGFPEEVGQELVDDFLHYGFEAELLPLFWENREDSAFDPMLVEKISDYGSIFFSGGDQSRIVETLIQDGQETLPCNAFAAVTPRAAWSRELQQGRPSCPAR